MRSFISEVLQHLASSSRDISKCTFILPNKRAGLFLKESIKIQLTPPSFLPEIFSIEEFIEELSNLRNLSTIEVLFEFYTLYRDVTPAKEVEPFGRFSRWASIIVQDFNEIDRNLIETGKIFKYLDAIDDINHWSLDPRPTKMIKGYLKFWEKIELYYNKFSAQLLEKGIAYQGLIYKEAVQNLDSYIATTNRDFHIFLGFNALNKSESLIFQKLLSQNQADIFWDADSTFLEADYHDAGFFMRDYMKQWPYYKSNKFNFISSNFQLPKDINIIGANKQIGQVKYAAELLGELNKKNSLESTALVLSDETLLLPLINSLPSEIKSINITMGLPLSQIPITTLILQWLKVHKSKTKKFYYKDVVNLLSNSQLNLLINDIEHNSIQKLIYDIKKHNLIEVSLKEMIQFNPAIESPLKLIFDNYGVSVNKCIKQLIALLDKICSNLNQSNYSNNILSECSFRSHEIIQQIQHYNLEYEVIDSIQTLEVLYKEVISKEMINFKGNPFSGLQIMGMLETRVIDYETVIILSLNEGIIPSGKTQNSYIPFDVKIENSLPTYKEKDAIYTYHFYRVLHRVREAYLIYNTHVDAIKGSEPSRFLAQFEIENIHNLKYQILAPKAPDTTRSIRRINKTSAIIDKLKRLANEGFSPSSLSLYIKNPVEFYNLKVLGVSEADSLEETIEAKTFGNIIHYCLEELYKPFVGEFLKVSELKELLPKVENIVKKFFVKAYKNVDVSKGKNLIGFEIAKRYINNFLNQEIDYLVKGHKIMIHAVEKKVETIIELPGLNFPIHLKGKVDRIDSFDGVNRIIDYKSSRVVQSDLNIVDLSGVVVDYKKNNKGFQLLMYAYIINKMDLFRLPFEAGILSFKNFKAGILKLKLKDKSGRKGIGQSQINDKIIDGFQLQLANLLIDIFNIENDFIEKEV